MRYKMITGKNIGNGFDASECRFLLRSLGYSENVVTLFLRRKNNEISARFRIFFIRNIGDLSRCKLVLLEMANSIRREPATSNIKGDPRVLLLFFFHKRS